jgi:hypothetical protein
MEVQVTGEAPLRSSSGTHRLVPSGQASSCVLYRAGTWLPGTQWALASGSPRQQAASLAGLAGVLEPDDCPGAEPL